MLENGLLTGADFDTPLTKVGGFLRSPQADLQRCCQKASRQSLVAKRQGSAYFSDKGQAKNRYVELVDLAGGKIR